MGVVLLNSVVPVTNVQKNKQTNKQQQRSPVRVQAHTQAHSLTVTISRETTISFVY